MTDWPTIVECLPDGAIVVGSDGVIRQANSAAHTLFAYAAGELVGEMVDSLVDESVRRQHALRRQDYHSQAGPRPMQGERSFAGVRKDGSPVELLISLVPLVGSDGVTVAFVREAPTVARMQSQARLALAAIDAAANGICITDSLGSIVHINPAFTRLTGYSHAEVVGKNPRVLKSGKHDEALYRQMWVTIHAGKVWSGEVVNRRKDGSLYVEEQTITPVRSESGTITHYIAIKQDVSRQHEDRAALERRLDELTVLHDLALLSVSGVSADVLVERAREVTMRRLKLEDVRIEVEGVSSAPPPSSLREPATGTELTRSLQVDGRSVGRIVAVFASEASVGEEAGLLLDTVASQLALAMKSAELVRELERRAHTDALTQLCNRGRFMELALAEVERAQRYQRALCLVTLDVDRFKDINDTMGHPYGDTVLQRLATVLSSICRLSDVVARLGGDEFVALLPETPADGAVRMVERLRAELAIGAAAGLPSCTVSAGVAEFGLDHDDLHPMLRAADEALYEAKREGRNRVVLRRSRRGSRKDFVAMRRSAAPPED